MKWYGILALVFSLFLLAGVVYAGANTDKVGFVLIPTAFASLGGPLILDMEIPENDLDVDCYEKVNCFLPQKMYLIGGQYVRITNNDIVTHTITSGSLTDEESGLVFDVTITPNEIVELERFEKVGWYPYFCKIHPWMQGTFVSIHWMGGILDLQYPDWYQLVIDRYDEGKISTEEFNWSFHWMKTNGFLSYVGY